jgi:hypothetical protein
MFERPARPPVGWSKETLKAKMLSLQIPKSPQKQWRGPQKSWLYELISHNVTKVTKLYLIGHKGSENTE